MKKPAIRSRTTCCAPKARAAPMIDAPAMKALTFTPRSDRIAITAMVQMTGAPAPPRTPDFSIGGPRTGEPGGRGPLAPALSVPLQAIAVTPPPPATVQPAPTPKRLRRLRRTWPQRLVLTGCVALSVVCFGAALAVWYANERLEDLERVVITHATTVTVAGSDPSAGTAAPATIDTTPGMAQNYLLIGSDSRKGSC